MLLVFCYFHNLMTILIHLQLNLCKWTPVCNDQPQLFYYKIYLNFWANLWTTFCKSQRWSKYTDWLVFTYNRKRMFNNIYWIEFKWKWKWFSLLLGLVESVPFLLELLPVRIVRRWRHFVRRWRHFVAKRKSYRKKSKHLDYLN